MQTVMGDPIKLFFVIVAIFIIMVISSFFAKKWSDKAFRQNKKFYKSLNKNSDLYIKPNKIESELSKLRRYRKLFWIVFFTFLPIGAISFSLDKFSSAFKLFPFIWMALWAYIFLKWIFFRCPKCGYIFHSEATWGNLWRHFR